MTPKAKAKAEDPLKIEILIPETLIDDVMSNYPEASMCLTCIAYKYQQCEFTFWDPEAEPDRPSPSLFPPEIKDLNLKRSGEVKDAVTYKLDRKKLRTGMKILLKQLENNKLRGLNLQGANILDAGNWDAVCADALVQCSIFGDVIYG